MHTKPHYCTTKYSDLNSWFCYIPSKPKYLKTKKHQTISTRPTIVFKSQTHLLQISNYTTHHKFAYQSKHKPKIAMGLLLENKETSLYDHQLWSSHRSLRSKGSMESFQCKDHKSENPDIYRSSDNWPLFIDIRWIIVYPVGT